MATSTTNLGLTKPAGTDKIRIAQINGNMDILDEKIGAVGNTSLQAQVTSQNEAITNLNNRFTKLVSPDLNNVRTSGLYYAQGATHSPGGSSNWWGFVTVIANSEQSEVKQVFYVNSSDETYTRYLRNSAWSDWQKFAMDTSQYGEITTDVQYEKCSNVVTIYFNGAVVSSASSWTQFADLPSGLNTRYSAHFLAMSGQEIQISGSVIRYRGNGGNIFGAFTYVRG